MRKKQIWVSPLFHRQLKKRAFDEDLTMLEYTDKISLNKKKFEMGGQNEKKKKKFTFSI